MIIIDPFVSSECSSECHKQICLCTGAELELEEIDAELMELMDDDTPGEI
jgi:hypothetical protein